jgi:hypothetical protein
MITKHKIWLSKPNKKIIKTPSKNYFSKLNRKTITKEKKYFS